MPGVRGLLSRAWRALRDALALPPTSRPSNRGPQEQDLGERAPRQPGLVSPAVLPRTVVWAWVPFEDDPSHGKDRPVLVVGHRGGSTVLGLMLSGQERRLGHPDWLDVGPGPWDPQGRPSSVRLDRVLPIPVHRIRRVGGTLRPTLFSDVVHELDRRGWPGVTRSASRRRGWF